MFKDPADGELYITDEKIKTIEAMYCLGLRGTWDRETILSEEEHHIDWLEAQLSLIESIGLPNYLTQKLGPTVAEH